MTMSYADHMGARNRADSGSVMVLTLMVLILVTMMALAVLTVTGNSLFMTTKQRTQAEAFNIAESGAELGAQYLRKLSYAPSQLSPINLYTNVALGTGTYSVVIQPDANNPASFLKTYKIVSTGTVGSQSKKVEIVVKQATFGRFAYFTDRETSNVSGGAIWWKAGEVCDGPAHSNNTGGSNFQINYNGSNAPIFKDMLTASGTSINYSPSRPNTEAKWRKVYQDGSKGFKLGVPRIDLPPSSDAQRNAAWGADYGFPSTNGVFLRSDQTGGLFIRGDAQIEMGVNSSGQQTIKVTQGSNVTTITVNLDNGTMSSTGPVGTGSPSSCANMPNGVIYCTGNITSLKGTVADNRYSGETITRRSSWTIATDVNSDKDITITGSLKYKTRPDKTLDNDDPTNLAAGTLGLVARDIDIAASAPSNLEINAVCLAGGQNTSNGSFSAVDYDSRKPVGTLTILGGIIQKARGAVGTFNSSTGQMSTGFAKNYGYDPRLATDPPPYYPTTGTYERLSWRVLP